MSIIPTVRADEQAVADLAVLSSDTSRPAVAIMVIGSPDARIRARSALGVLSVAESAGWNELPGGPTVCVDADRFDYLSPQGIELLADALLLGHDLVVPASNIGPWPLCGLESPRGAATPEALDAHSVSISTLALEHIVTSGCPLPAVFGVADAARITGRPNRVGDLADHAAVVSAAWCHHRQTLLITASMIVKNEAARIEGAIASVRGFADEVVVYDTGSDDDTIALALGAGAAVRSGYWDDDFSRARNESIKMGRGEWTLVIDADDEVLGTDEGFAAVRDRLASVGARECVAVNVSNIGNATTGEILLSSMSRRLFRHDLRYRRRVHEEPYLADGSLPEPVPFNEVSIRHSGYAGDQNERWNRNLRLLELRVGDAVTQGEQAHALLEYARALIPFDRHDQALSILDEVIRLDVGEHVSSAARLFICAVVGKRDGRDAAMAAAAPLIARGGIFGDAARWIAAMHCEIAEGLALLEPVEFVDTMYVGASADDLRSTRSLWRALLGDLDGAIAEVLTLEVSCGTPNWWVAALAADIDDVRVASFLAGLATPDDLAEAVAALAAAPPIGSHTVVSTLWDRFAAAEPLVVYLSQMSHRGGFLIAFDARMMLMEAGRLGAGDPLVAVIEHGAGTADALLAAMILDDLEPLTTSRGAQAAALIEDEHIPEVLSAVQVVYPDAMDLAVALLGSTDSRRDYALELAALLAA